MYPTIEQVKEIEKIRMEALKSFTQLSESELNVFNTCLPSKYEDAYDMDDFKDFEKWGRAWKENGREQALRCCRRYLSEFIIGKSVDIYAYPYEDQCLMDKLKNLASSKISNAIGYCLSANPHEYQAYSYLFCSCKEEECRICRYRRIPLDDYES